MRLFVSLYVHSFTVSGPKKRAIAWSDSEESDVEQQSADRVTTVNGSRDVDSDRFAPLISCMHMYIHMYIHTYVQMYAQTASIIVIK